MTEGLAATLTRRRHVKVNDGEFMILVNDSALLISLSTTDNRKIKLLVSFYWR